LRAEKVALVESCFNVFASADWLVNDERCSIRLMSAYITTCVCTLRVDMISDRWHTNVYHVHMFTGTGPFSLSEKVVIARSAYKCMHVRSRRCLHGCSWPLTRDVAVAA